MILSSEVHFTSLMSNISKWSWLFNDLIAWSQSALRTIRFNKDVCNREHCRKTCFTTHPFSITGHWPDMSCLFEHSCLSSNKQIFNWIIGLDLLTRNLSLRSNALCYFSCVIVGWMGAIAGWYKYFRLDNPVMFRFALCPNTQFFLSPAAHDQFD